MLKQESRYGGKRPPPNGENMRLNYQLFGGFFPFLSRGNFARLAWPLSAAYFLEMAMSILCLFMLVCALLLLFLTCSQGQLSAEDLAAGSLAFSIIQVFGLSPGFGILTGLDSLAAQAWGAGGCSVLFLVNL